MAASSSIAKPPKLVAPTLSDFEQVYEVVPNQGAALQRLPIADVIYQKSHAPDLYDSVVAYQLTHQDKILKNEALYFQTQEKELYLQTRLGPNELAPPLIIWYYPQYLLFVGEGSSPYHLGVGLKPGNWLPPPEIPLPLLETTANEIPVVKLGISTDQNLPPKNASGSPVSQKVFWVILGNGFS